METRGYRRRTARARYVPNHIPRGGHVEDAVHDQRQYRAETGAERPEQDHPGGAQGGDRAHRALQRPNPPRSTARPPGRSCGQSAEINVDGHQTRADRGARWPWVGQDVAGHRRVPGVR